MSICKLQVIGQIALLETEDFNIEIVGSQHIIKMKVSDPGGYKKVKAEHVLPHILSVIAELDND